LSSVQASPVATAAGFIEVEIGDALDGELLGEAGEGDVGGDEAEEVAVVS